MTIPFAVASASKWMNQSFWGAFPRAVRLEHYRFQTGRVEYRAHDVFLNTREKCQDNHIRIEDIVCMHGQVGISPSGYGRIRT